MASRRRREFGSIRERGRGKYQAAYTDLDGHRHSLGIFPTRVAANGALSDVETQIGKGNWIDPRQAARTVRDVAMAWLASNPHKRANTYAADLNDIEKHILPGLGDLTISSVRPPSIQHLVNIWAKTAAPRTVERRCRTLKALFTYCVNNDWLARSPWRGIKVPKVTSTRSYPLTPEDVAAVAEATVLAYRPMVWLGALTGCRWSEAAGLRVGDLNLLAKTMRVEQVVVKDQHGRPVVYPPKSQASARVIALPDVLVSMIAEHLARVGLTGADLDAYVFTSPTGGLLRQDNWRRRVWIPALKVAGLDTATPRPGFHDLRRAVGTTLVSAGVNPKTAQTRLGHSDVRTTLQIYARAVEQKDRDAAEVLATNFMARDSSLAPTTRPEGDLKRCVGETHPSSPAESLVEVSGLEPPTSTLRT